MSDYRKKDASEEGAQDGSRRDDASRSGEGLLRFTKDKRLRTGVIRMEKILCTPHPVAAESGRKERPNRYEERKTSHAPSYNDGKWNRTNNNTPHDNRRQNAFGYEKPDGKREYDRTPKPAYGKRDDNAGSYEKRSGGSGRYGTDKPRRDDRYRQREFRPGEEYPKFAAPKLDRAIRLNRFLSISGIASRREADDLILAGTVTVNGRIVTELGTKVQPSDEVRFNNSIVHGEKKVYILMNKPKGYVTSLEDPHAEKIVMEIIKGAVTERVYPVGRLDKNSMGVLLITNDGDLTKRLTHPSYRKKKVYQVSLNKALAQADMERIAAGIELEDGPIHADEIAYVDDTRKEIGIEIHSGRNRIVRRIFEYMGYKVQKLDRVYFAGLTKKRLKRGAWRFLTPREVAILKSGEYE